MIGEIANEAFNVCGPPAGRTSVIAVTSTASKTDVSQDANIGADVIAGRMLRIRAEGCDVYYSWYRDNSISIDDTAASGTTVPGLIPAGQFVDERPPIGAASATDARLVKWTFLNLKSASGLTGKARIYPVTIQPGGVYS